MSDNAMFIVYSGPNTTFIMLMESNVPHLKMGFIFTIYVNTMSNKHGKQLVGVYSTHKIFSILCKHTFM